MNAAVPPDQALLVPDPVLPDAKEPHEVMPEPEEIPAEPQVRELPADPTDPAAEAEGGPAPQPSQRAQISSEQFSDCYCQGLPAIFHIAFGST